MSAVRVLVVDDDRSVREMLREYLSSHGYEVALADGGDAMQAELQRAAPAVVLLDVRMPGTDGLTLARYLREHHDVGIIMITGAGEVIDRVAGLEVGADDYIAKPFDPRELHARLRSLLRRIDGGSRTRSALRETRVVVGRCRLDLRSHQLSDLHGQEVPITSTEFDLLKLLVEHPNQVLSRDHLLAATRHREWEPLDRSIDIHIARLRRKVEDDPDRPRTIRTVRGAGYMFVPGEAGAL